MAGAQVAGGLAGDGGIDELLVAQRDDRALAALHLKLQIHGLAVDFASRREGREQEIVGLAGGGVIHVEELLDEFGGGLGLGADVLERPDLRAGDRRTMSRRWSSVLCMVPTPPEGSLKRSGALATIA